MPIIFDVELKGGEYRRAGADISFQGTVNNYFYGRQDVGELLRWFVVPGPGTKGDDRVRIDGALVYVCLERDGVRLLAVKE